MPDNPTTPPVTPPYVIVRDDDFTSLYANNVRFEDSIWDLKILFGQLDQSKTPNTIEQHTAIAMPWIQAKLCAYYLLVNMVIHQNQVGQIMVPASVLPPRPDPNDSSLDENGKKVITYLGWVHDQFFSDHPFAPPGTE